VEICGHLFRLRFFQRKNSAVGPGCDAKSGRRSAGVIGSIESISPVRWLFCSGGCHPAEAFGNPARASPSSGAWIAAQAWLPDRLLFAVLLLILLKLGECVLVTLRTLPDGCRKSSTRCVSVIVALNDAESNAAIGSFRIQAFDSA